MEVRTSYIILDLNSLSSYLLDYYHFQCWFCWLHLIHINKYILIIYTSEALMKSVFKMYICSVPQSLRGMHRIYNRRVFLRNSLTVSGFIYMMFNFQSSYHNVLHWIKMFVYFRHHLQIRTSSLKNNLRLLDSYNIVISFDVETINLSWPPAGCFL